MKYYIITMKKRITVSLDEKIVTKLNEMRGEKTQFASKYINDLLKERLEVK